ncbi:MAG: molybdopterin dehydrogenase [Gammaproteobacteria bacterium]|nr:molybdopterin dehydrogenase [Gammaproteobacteria bacterium]
MKSFACIKPGCLADLAEFVKAADGIISFIAGGTDLVIAMENGAQPDLIVDVSDLKELNFVDVDEVTETIRIGAATPVSVLAQHSGVVKNATALAQAALQIGSVQIRNRATIGGNIASAMPAGDLLPVLKCLECKIEIQHTDGHSGTYTFEEVVTGSGTTCLSNGDLITAIVIPQHPLSAFVKIGRRQVLTIASLNLAAVADYQSESGYLNDIRIVAGAIGAVPLRLQQVEQQIRDRIVDQACSDTFLCALSDAVDTAIAGRCSQPYKHHAIMGLGLDLMNSLFDKSFDLPLVVKNTA